MNALARLEEQSRVLTTMSQGSKLLDTFSEVSHSIVARAERIANDVHPWEAAQENITSTIEEMTRASRCYHTPQFVPRVLRKKEKDPMTVCRAIDHIVFSCEYLSSRPSNDYGDQLQQSMEKKLTQVAKVADELIVEMFVNAFHSFGTAKDHRTPRRMPLTRHASSAAVRSATTSSGIVPNRNALTGVDALIKKVYECFNSTRAVTEEVAEMFEQRTVEILESMFDATYMEENESAAAPQTTHINMASLTKHYRKGQHDLLALSAKCREVVRDLSSVLESTIVLPLEGDYDAVELPPRFAKTVFDKVMHHANEAVRIDMRMTNNSTRMFISSRGAGIGLCPARPNDMMYFRDRLFCGLDLVPELWRWRTVAAELSGAKDEFEDHVTSELESFLGELRRVMEVYREAKGTIEAGLLKRLTVELQSSDWFPPFDCTAHESSTNALYLIKILYVDYFGSTKLVLNNGQCESPEDDEAALRELEEFTQQVISGTMIDLETIADVAAEMQQQTIEKRGKNVMSLANNVVPFAKDRARCRLSGPLFLVNNASFMMENIKRGDAFLCRTMIGTEEEEQEAKRLLPAALSTTTIGGRNQQSNKAAVASNSDEEDEEDEEEDDRNNGSESDASDREAREKRRAERRAKAEVARRRVPIVLSSLQLLQSQLEDQVQAYIESWESLFPDVRSSEILESIDELRYDKGAVLSKPQRYAVKQWYGEVAQNLRRKVGEGTVHAVLSSEVRTRLIEGVTDVVESKFKEMEDFLEEKEWSTRPLKWIRQTPEDWLAEIQRMF